MGTGLTCLMQLTWAIAWKKNLTLFRQNMFSSHKKLLQSESVSIVRPMKVPDFSVDLPAAHTNGNFDTPQC